MKYALILQFTEGVLTFDELISLEDALTLQIRKGAVVDGHDFGCGEMNIFILTDYPKIICQLVMLEVKRRKLEFHARIGYRTREADEITILHPPGLSKFEVK